MTSPQTVTASVADFITAITFDDLPEAVVNKAKLFILDSIGCGMGGSQTAIGQTAVDALSQTCSGTAHVLGRDVQVGTGTAALLNAMSINALDYDDSDPSGHPSSTLVGTLLALCNQVPGTGQDFLLSYVTGFDVSSRVGQSLFPTEERFAEVFGLGTHQTFGAVTAAAKFRKLDKQQTLDAMGIAGASAPVPSGQKWGWDNRPLSWVKDAVAMPAQVGVTATTLAAAGFVGCRDILDGDTGFWRMAASDRCDLSVITQGLGEDFLLMNSAIKTYACCWFIHPTLDALKSIVSEQSLSHQDIASIDVWSLSDLYRFFNFTQPQEMVDVQFSLPYCVALTLCGIETGPEWVNPERFKDALFQSIGARVNIHSDTEADKHFHESRRIPARVKVTTVSGDEFEAYAPAPRGTQMVPITDQDVIDKYLSMAVPVLGVDKADELLAFVLSLESQSDASRLAELISV